MTKILLLSLSLFGLLLAPAGNGAGTGAQQSRERELRRVGAMREETKQGRTPQLWGVVIGVSIYQYGEQTINGDVISNLKNAADDAQAVYDFLRSDAGGGFRDVKEGGHLVLLKDEEATTDKVNGALDALRQARPEDYFVIFIAAHGTLIDRYDAPSQANVEEPYFVLHNSRLDQGEQTALRMAAFLQKVKSIPARKGLVLSDTCHSGGLFLAGRKLRAVARANERYLDEMSKVAQGIGMIASARENETSREEDRLGHGVFTHFLLRALQGQADADQDRVVTFQEVRDYLGDQVPGYTGQKQHPVYQMSAVEANDLPLAVVAYAGNEPCGDHARCGILLLRAPDLEGVEVSVDGASIGTLNRVERTVRVPAGVRKLTFSKGGLTRERETIIEPNETKIVEINLAFSKDEADALDGPALAQDTVFLPEAAPSKPALELFLSGVDEFNKQRFAPAIEKFTRALQANGGVYPDALVYRGQAEQSLGRRAQAVASFRQALSQRPQDYETETLLTEARFNAGDNVNEIVRDLRRIISRHRNHDFAYVVLGDIYLSRGQMALAEQSLRRAILIKPASPPAHLILADALTYQDSPDKQRQAVKEAEQALQLFEELSRKKVSTARGLSHLSISHVIFGGGRYVNAAALAEAHHALAKTLTRLVENDRTLPDAGASLDRARDHLKQAESSAKSSGDQLRLAGILTTSVQNYWLKADAAQALAEGERALKLAQTLAGTDDLQADVHFTLRQVYENSQQYRQAAAHLQRFIELAAPRLGQDARQGYEEELRMLKQKADANRQKK